MIDPRITQRQIEIEKKKKQQQQNKVLQMGQSSYSKSAATNTTANTIADGVYKSNSGFGSNEYTTTAQRQAQQKSLQEQKARENYI